ncbi:hypothetical protein EKA14_19900 [Bacillus mycoides]|nr:hypothetical protein EKA14_19900 [Bacillus mycoides]
MGKSILILFLIDAKRTLGCIINCNPKSFLVLSRYLRAVKLPPRNSAGAKKLGGSPAARKRPIGEG